ncbi:DNA-binding protein, partial [Staphylococcus cohnii]
YKAYPLFKFDIEKKFESYMVVIGVEGQMDGSPHGSNTMEYITVYEGTLTLILDGETFVIHKNEAIKFNGNIFHQYLNQHDEPVYLHMTIHY